MTLKTLPISENNFFRLFHKLCVELIYVKWLRKKETELSTKVLWSVRWQYETSFSSLSRINKRTKKRFFSLIHPKKKKRSSDIPGQWDQQKFKFTRHPTDLSLNWHFLLIIGQCGHMYVLWIYIHLYGRGDVVRSLYCIMLFSEFPKKY